MQTQTYQGTLPYDWAEYRRSLQESVNHLGGDAPPGLKALLDLPVHGDCKPRFGLSLSTARLAEQYLTSHRALQYKSLERLSSLSDRLLTEHGFDSGALSDILLLLTRWTIAFQVTTELCSPPQSDHAYVQASAKPLASQLRHSLHAIFVEQVTGIRKVLFATRRALASAKAVSAVLPLAAILHHLELALSSFAAKPLLPFDHLPDRLDRLLAELVHTASTPDGLLHDASRLIVAIRDTTASSLKAAADTAETWQHEHGTNPVAKFDYVSQSRRHQFCVV